MFGHRRNYYYQSGFIITLKVPSEHRRRFVTQLRSVQLLSNFKVPATKTSPRFHSPIVIHATSIKTQTEARSRKSENRNLHRNKGNSILDTQVEQIGPLSRAKSKRRSSLFFIFTTAGHAYPK